MALFLPSVHIRPNLLLGDPTNHVQARGLVHWFPVFGNQSFTGPTQNPYAVTDVMGGRHATNIDYIALAHDSSLPGTTLSDPGIGTMLSCMTFIPKAAQFLSVADGGQGATLTAWIKLSVATPLTDPLTGFAFIQKDTVGLSPYSHYPYTNGLVYLTTFRHARVDGISPSTLVNRSDWHLVGVTYDGVTWKLYQNAILVHTDTTGDGHVYTASSAINGGTASFHGSLDADALGFSFRLNGQSCDWRLYNRVLTQGEMQDLYNPWTRWSLYYGT